MKDARNALHAGMKNVNKKMIKVKIKERPNWDEFFMMHAYLAAARSSCFHLNTGAAIVKDKRIIAMGYNGAPSGVKNSFEYGWCRKEKFGIDFDKKGTGTCRGRHAEENAMSQPSRQDLKGATLYSVYYPCSTCAKSIVGNDISRIVYSKVYKEKDSLSEEIFKEKEIEIINLNLDFERLNKFLSNLK